jgi:hypothetical protein
MPEGKEGPSKDAVIGESRQRRVLMIGTREGSRGRPIRMHVLYLLLALACLVLGWVLRGSEVEKAEERYRKREVEIRWEIQTVSAFVESLALYMRSLLMGEYGQALGQLTGSAEQRRSGKTPTGWGDLKPDQPQKLLRCFWVAVGRSPETTVSLRGCDLPLDPNWTKSAVLALDSVTSGTSFVPGMRGESMLNAAELMFSDDVESLGIAYTRIHHYHQVLSPNRAELNRMLDRIDSGKTHLSGTLRDLIAGGLYLSLGNAEAALHIAGKHYWAMNAPGGENEQALMAVYVEMLSTSRRREEAFSVAESLLERGFVTSPILAKKISDCLGISLGRKSQATAISGEKSSSENQYVYYKQE